ncbi:MAG: flagellin [Candidatus Latescibacterota bacterium]|nr:flagellin [Candidatus Latescibacterota bacterium]
MPLRVGTNVTSINAGRHLNTATRSFSKNIERLSSGLRINRGADDAAGLSVTEGMRAELTGIKQGVRNANAGIHLIQTAEGALNEVSSILVRMRELAMSSANSTLTDKNRGGINTEFQQLKTELDRIAASTNYNNQTLLSGFGNTVSTNPLTSTALDGFGGLKEIGISGAMPGTYTFTDNSDSDNQISLAITLDDGTMVEQSIDIGEAMDLDDGKNLVATGATFVGNFDRLGVQLNLVGPGVSFQNTWKLDAPLGEAAAINLVTHTEEACDPACVNIEAGQSLEDIQVALDAALKDLNPEAFARIDDITGELQVDVKDIETEGFETSGFTSGNVYEDGRLHNKTFHIASSDGGVIQVGDNDNSDNRILVNIDDMRTRALNLDGVSVANIVNSRAAIWNIDTAIYKVSRQRGDLGAVQNRLEHTTESLANAIENLQASESAIRDADVAEEISAFTRSQILTQAATAMVAQANALPRNALTLLQG